MRSVPGVPGDLHPQYQYLEIYFHNISTWRFTFTILVPGDLLPQYQYLEVYFHSTSTWIFTTFVFTLATLPGGNTRHALVVNITDTHLCPYCGSKNDNFVLQTFTQCNFTQILVGTLTDLQLCEKIFQTIPKCLATDVLGTPKSRFRSESFSLLEFQEFSLLGVQPLSHLAFETFRILVIQPFRYFVILSFIFLVSFQSFRVLDIKSLSYLEFGPFTLLPLPLPL